MTAGSEITFDEMSTISTGRAVFAGSIVVFAAIAMPVVWRGALLGDDFNNCLAPMELGLGGFLAASWDRLGMIRPARFVEILLTTGVCRDLPFGLAIAVPFLLTLVVAWQTRGLLRDLRTPPPWSDVGGALWLLHPLGTEAALWPAALHVPLGLTFALLALRAYHRGRHGWAALATFGAALSVEQVILALPVAAWLIVPPEERRRAAAIASVVAVAVLATFVLWPGDDPRLRVGMSERVSVITSDVRFYAGYPAVGLGFHSIPLAIYWAFPWSIVVLAVGAALGRIAARRLPRTVKGVSRRDALRGAIWLMALLLLANVPVVVSVPHQGSPRVFAPTWLILVSAIALFASRTRVRYPSLVGVTAGLFATGAVLSLALSVSVRLTSADFTERAVRMIASRVPDRGSVALCGVRRTVSTPAPRGAFAVHELVYDWGAERALTYYTGQKATFYLAGELWDHPCRTPREVDVVLTFDELLARARQ